LTDIEQKYCDEYLNDHNQTAAAIRAGVKPSNAKDWATKKNASKAAVRAYIDRQEAQISRRLGISAERTKAELAKLAYGNASDIINTDDATVFGDARRDDTAAIQSVKVKTTHSKDGSEIVEREIRLYDKTKALELLGRADGMFTDNLKTEITGTIIIDADVTDDKPDNA
jgi:phage terminase small subunit